MGEFKTKNTTIKIEDITLWSYFSTLYLKPKLFISFELMDFFGDDDCEVCFSLKHIELDGYSDAKELVNNEIQLNEIELNKTLNTEYLNGEEYKIVSVSFYVSDSSEGYFISGKGTFSNSQTGEINQFQFDSNVTVNPTNLLAVSHDDFNSGYARGELISSIGNLYNSKGMLSYKNSFPNVHRGYEIINSWSCSYGLIYQRHLKDYSQSELLDITELIDLVSEFVESYDKDGISLPDIPKLYVTPEWTRIKEKAKEVLISIELKGVHPSYKACLELGE